MTPTLTPTLTLTPDELRRELTSDTPPLVIDVRRPEDRRTGRSIPGADWRDPLLLEDWAGGIPAGTEAVVFCVRGGAVSRNVQDQLARRGIRARYVEGGLAAWNESEPAASKP